MTPITAIILAIAACLAIAPGAARAENGVTDTEIRIGDVDILTGPTSFIGQAVSIGTRVAAAEINAKGGINGRKLVILTEDDGYVPARSFQAAKKLIEQDEVFALNGTSGTANLLAMLPLIDQYGVPVVVTTAPSVLAYAPDHPSVFTVGGTYSDAFYGMLKYIHENREPKDAVYGLIRQDDDFGASLEQGYDRAVKAFNLKDGIRLRFKRGQKEFGAEALQLRQAGVNVFANGSTIGASAAMLAELHKLDVPLQVAAVWSETMPVSVKLSQPSGYRYIVADYVATPSEPAGQAFTEAAKQYLTPQELAGVNRYTLLSYAGLKLLAAAAEQCGKDLTRPCEIEQLRKLHGFETGGLLAPISFDNPKQLSGTALKLHEVDYATMGFTALTGFVQY
jgi:ABC-type branched-subunit amino acid transport system substrate-binding protein